PCSIGRLAMKASAENVVWTWRSPKRICFAGGVPGASPVAARASSGARAATTGGGTRARVTSPGPWCSPRAHATTATSIPSASRLDTPRPPRGPRLGQRALVARRNFHCQSTDAARPTRRVRLLARRGPQHLVFAPGMHYAAPTMARDVLRTPDDRFMGLPGYAFGAHYLEVGGLRIHHLDEGPQPAPPVLLLHGQPSWSYLYRKMIPLLAAAGCRAVAPDLVGFRRSDKPTEPDDYHYQPHVASRCSCQRRPTTRRHPPTAGHGRRSAGGRSRSSPRSATPIRSRRAATCSSARRSPARGGSRIRPSPAPVTSSRRTAARSSPAS